MIVIVLGIIVPKIFITSYGSDINGLLSTISQIFTYMALLEAGIGQAAQNALYGPVKENDKDGIIHVVSVAKSYFKRLTWVYGMGVILLAVLIPFVLKTNVDRTTVILIVLLEGMSDVFSFFFIQTPSVLLAVSGKSYINNEISVINKIAGYATKIILASAGANIVLLQFAYFVIVILKVVFYEWYIRKNYQWLKYEKTKASDKLPDRNAYVLTEVAWTIFSSTDMIVLSSFLSTEMASVYSIYAMIFTNINLLVNGVFGSIKYLLGYAYHEGVKEYERMHDAFNSTFLGIMTILMSVAYVLTLPFIRLYTSGITDANYIYESLPMMFCLVQIISWSRYVSGNLTGIAGYAKKTSYVSLIEALLNVVLSILLVNRFGIVGVLFATVISLPIKVVWCTYISDVKIMKRSIWKTISILSVNYLLFAGVVVISKVIPLEVNSYGQFLVYGLVLSAVIGIVGTVANVLVNKECLRVIRRLFHR